MSRRNSRNMLLKEEIELAVNRQKKLFDQHLSLTPREAKNKINKGSRQVEVITGIRRSGKSSLMRQLIEEYTPNYSYLNFEDPRLFDFTVDDFSKLDEILESSGSPYFFDEIQNVKGWEVYVRQLHDHGQKVFITGSNASLLSRELGTRLTGRYLAYEIFPFSYSEFLEYHAWEDNAENFQNYLDLGGFPEYLRDKNPEILQNLLKDIVFRDIAIRYSIKNTKTLLDITLYLISNVGKEISYNGIKKTFEIGSANTVSDYLNWLEDAYLLFFLPRFSWSAKSISKNPKKVYCIDTGFARANSLSFSKDQGRLLENLVYLIFRKTTYQLFYYREKKECDFVVFEEKTCKWAVQVSEKIHSENKNREIEGLFEAMSFFDLKEGFILTLDQEDSLSVNGKMIRLLPVRAFQKIYLS
ncbi:ATP-binding protein [Algoriphagus sp. NF]|uniref:ATP-binding protein n=1 Tax=Algoriphagus sp. NF TaxID=2992756 RepID=UPI00237AAF01|nr:ATP-binding protein [Algoriphagus sp. NF]MDE0559917.1 ATP-binding protein [Algoriphagus sp. NF]